MADKGKESTSKEIDVQDGDGVSVLAAEEDMESSFTISAIAGGKRTEFASPAESMTPSGKSKRRRTHSTPPSGTYGDESGDALYEWLSGEGKRTLDRMKTNELTRQEDLDKYLKKARWSKDNESKMRAEIKKVNDTYAALLTLMDNEVRRKVVSQAPSGRERVVVNVKEQVEKSVKEAMAASVLEIREEMQKCVREEVASIRENEKAAKEHREDLHRRCLERVSNLSGDVQITRASCEKAVEKLNDGVKATEEAAGLVTTSIRAVTKQVKEIKEKTNVADLSEIKKVVEKVRKDMTKKGEETFADKVKKVQEESEGKVKIIIRSEGKESEDVKKMVREKLKPSESGLRVERIGKVKNGVIIEIESEEKEKVMDTVRKGIGEGGKVDEAKGARPMIRVVGVDKDMKEEDFLKELREMNLEEVTEDEWKESAKVVRRFVGRFGDATFLLRVNPELREKLVAMEKVYVGWMRCRVEDYVEVFACMKCGAYGHKGKECKREKSVCFKCGEEGHASKTCKSETKKCPNCKRAGKPDEHGIFTSKCPLYEREIGFQLRRVGWSQRVSE